MKVSFAETMRGRVRDAEGMEWPLDFHIKAEATSPADLRSGARQLSGLMHAQPWAREFESGEFATIYLAPYNYHRIHMPVAGSLRGTWFVPGRLFSVNAITATAAA